MNYLWKRLKISDMHGKVLISPCQMHTTDWLSQLRRQRGIILSSFPPAFEVVTRICVPINFDLFLLVNMLILHASNILLDIVSDVFACSIRSEETFQDVFSLLVYLEKNIRCHNVIANNEVLS